MHYLKLYNKYLIFVCSKNFLADIVNLLIYIFTYVHFPSR